MCACDKYRTPPKNMQKSTQYLFFDGYAQLWEPTGHPPAPRQSGFSAWTRARKGSVFPLPLPFIHRSSRGVELREKGEEIDVQNRGERSLKQLPVVGDFPGRLEVRLTHVQSTPHWIDSLVSSSYRILAYRGSPFWPERSVLWKDAPCLGSVPKNAERATAWPKIQNAEGDRMDIDLAKQAVFSHQTI